MQPRQEEGGRVRLMVVVYGRTGGGDTRVLTIFRTVEGSSSTSYRGSLNQPASSAFIYRIPQHVEGLVRRLHAASACVFGDKAGEEATNLVSLIRNSFCIQMDCLLVCHTKVKIDTRDFCGFSYMSHRAAM